MADRPIFIPRPNGFCLAEEISISFIWNKGMAPIQKRKNVVALHQAASVRGFSPLLEVSTKSENRLGQRLSAFNLKVEIDSNTSIPLECAYQGSKVFEQGGPFTDLYFFESRDAKRDSRLQTSGNLIGFSFQDIDFPIFPKTAFYDWLYIRAIFPHREYLNRLHSYAGFTDIEFNPEKSLNCQARSCATFVALDKNGLLSESMESLQAFIDILQPGSVKQFIPCANNQQSLFAA